MLKPLPKRGIPNFAVRKRGIAMPAGSGSFLVLPAIKAAFSQVEVAAAALAEEAPVAQLCLLEAGGQSPLYFPPRRIYLPANGVFRFFGIRKNARFLDRLAAVKTSAFR